MVGELVRQHGHRTNVLPFTLGTKSLVTLLLNNSIELEVSLLP